MTTGNEKALRLALEALQNAQANFGEWWPEAITAIKKALAKTEQSTECVEQGEPVAKDDADIYSFWARNKEAESKENKT